MDFCDNSVILQYFAVNLKDVVQDSWAQDFQKSLYRYLCPVLIMGCFVGVVLNLLLVVIGNSNAINKSPILVLSLNLATTDCLASLFVGKALVINSYLPVVFHIHLGNGYCNNLVVEIFRLSAMIASSMHLLCLALVHYKGIVKPSHYRAVMFCSPHKTRSIHLISFLYWIIPFIFFVLYFVTIPCQGFRSVKCNVHFVLTLRFRMVIVIAFFIPLIMMLFLYLRIFTIVTSHREQRQHGHTKAMITTLLILGTYLVCYFPDVIFFAVTCVNGCPFNILHMSMKIRIMFSFISNSLVILKAIVDPFIYTFRMREIKITLNRYCLKTGNLRNSKMTSQTLTTLRSTSSSSLKHRCDVAIDETSF